MDWAGTDYLSWWELSTVVDECSADPRSALFRKLHPDDHVWFDPQTALAAESATMLSDIRWWLAARASTEENDLVEAFGWHRAKYGPRDAEAAAENVSAEGDSSDDRARAAAAEILG